MDFLKKHGMKKTYLCIFLMIMGTVSFAQRDTIPLNESWLFSIGNNAQMALPVQFENAEKVNLPHTWNVEKGSEMYYGWGYYQKKFIVPANWKNKNVVLQFGAVNHICYILLMVKKPVKISAMDLINFISSSMEI